MWLIVAGAAACELGAAVLHTKSPLTRDFITIGRVPYCGDTGRFRSELLPTLVYPTLETGKATLV